MWDMQRNGRGERAGGGGMKEMKKWYAVKGPDGEWVQCGEPVNDQKQWSWEAAARHDPVLRGMCALSGSWWRKAERLGYRCVEVELTPKGRTERLMDAITWALGANGDFAERGPNDAAFWWRSELRRRAGLDWDGEKYVDVELVEKKP